MVLKWTLLQLLHYRILSIEEVPTLLFMYLTVLKIMYLLIEACWKDKSVGAL